MSACDAGPKPNPSESTDKKEMEMTTLGLTLWVFVVIGGLLALGGLGVLVWWLARRLGLIGWAEEMAEEE